MIGGAVGGSSGAILIVGLAIYFYYKRRAKGRVKSKRLDENEDVEVIEATEAPGELSALRRPSELPNKLDMYTELDGSNLPRR